MPRPPKSVRRATVAAAVAAVSGAAVLSLGAPAVAGTHHSTTSRSARHAAELSIARGFIVHLNKSREAHDVAPVAKAAGLTRIAAYHSWRMGTLHALYHNHGLPDVLHNWITLGENVGLGPTESEIASAFMHSAPHRFNILDGQYTQVGVGVHIDGKGNVWVTEDFRRPEAGTWPARHANHAIRRMERTGAHI